MKESLFPNGILLVSIHGRVYRQMDDLEKPQNPSRDDHSRMQASQNDCEDREPLRGF